MNTTYAFRYDPPFYFSQRASLTEALPDHLLTLAVPIIAYWSFSLFFHFLDISGWKWLDKYRIHESEEIKKRNLVGRSHVAMAVAFQQVLQTLMGLVWLENENIGTGSVASAARLARAVKGLQKWEKFLEPAVDFVVGRVGVGAGEKGAGLYFMDTAVGKEDLLAMAAYFTYWWAIPIFQFAFAM
jgi:sphinganine C4-monooxygenase